MVELIDGKKIANQIRDELKTEVEAFQKKTGITPGLATVLIGQDPASQVYVKSKIKATQACGMHSYHFDLNADASESEVLKLIDELNADARIHGILVQFPVPQQISQTKIIDRIHPNKDVDGLHAVNMGRLVNGSPHLISCTPHGVMKLLEKLHIPVSGKTALVIGRSNLVGKPMALLLLNADATVTIAHRHTADLKKLVQNSDIIVVAIGKPRFIAGDWIKKGAVVIDVGINRLEDGTLCGDVDFEGAKQRAAFLTPVPGGVGPMTIAMLLANTLAAAKNIF